ncbi:MAG: aminodeoxychorismate/anthranilate synthase component II [Christensenellaceae bacterium]|jgi:anthranilate synthase component 2|nr:aminodeoxychorismate/anthranilate synthase component II [Christensenellaceae bacterium]
MILLVDNYDSFSYNLYQLLGSMGAELLVIRNDAMGIAEIEGLAPERIVLSPGPGRPADAGICEEIIRHFGGKLPILGVCLGHQAICEVYGATIAHAKTLMHGKTSEISLDGSCPLFDGLPGSMQGARYHSLAARPETLPDCLRVTARAEDGEIMGVMHQKHAVFGLQFHPESILTPRGGEILQNFLKLSERGERS